MCGGAKGKHAFVECGRVDCIGIFVRLVSPHAAHSAKPLGLPREVQTVSGLLPGESS